MSFWDDTTEGKTKLVFFGWGNSAEVSLTEELVDEFNTSQDEIYVEYTPIASDSYATKIRNALSRSNVPDVIIAGDGEIKPWIEMDGLCELDEFIENSTVFDLDDFWNEGQNRYYYNKNIRMNYSDSIKDEFKDDFHYYGIMRDLSPSVLFYNVQALEKVGINIISIPIDKIDEYNEKHNTHYEKVGYKEWGGTYVAMWQDGSYYINNEKNVKELRTKVLFTDLENGTIKIEYLMFIGFDNNVNSNDPAYAYIKYNFFDAEDNSEPYNELDFINFKDDRMVHTHTGNSVSVHDAVDGIDNPHQVTWANKFKTQFTTLGLKRENLTLFVGDSYFEQEGWWTNFYSDYGGKNVFTSAIGGTKSWEWIHYLDELVKPYEDSNGNIQNIVVHLGYNEIVGCNNTLTSEILESHIVALLDKIHSRYNDTNIYYFGIGVSSYFDTISDKKQRSEEVDALTKAYAEKKSWLTFIDTNDIVQQYLNDHAGY